LGYIQQLSTEDHHLMTRDELLNHLQVLFAGRVSGEVIFGDISTGAQNDLQRATDITRSMVMEYGMSERLGLLTYAQQPQSRYLALGSGQREREYSERTAQEIDEEKSRIINEAHQRVLLKLNDHRHSLEKLAGILLEKESIDGEELKKFAEEVRAQAAAAGARTPDIV
jgi:cell division protease FtsH